MSNAGHRRRGSATIEFALSFGLMFAIFGGVFQFGYAFYLYNTLESAVRAGARYASLRTYDSGTATPSAAYLAAVRNTVLYGNPGGGTQPVVPGLTTANINVTMTMDLNVPYQVTVAIGSYQIDAIFTRIDLTGKPKAAFNYVGRFSPPTS
ncbi:MAG: TadE/TadG family type IV pilus assembly protein [Acidobacteriota bacterium]